MRLVPTTCTDAETLDLCLHHHNVPVELRRIIYLYGMYPQHKHPFPKWMCCPSCTFPMFGLQEGQPKEEYVDRMCQVVCTKGHSICKDCLLSYPLNCPTCPSNEMYDTRLGNPIDNLTVNGIITDYLVQHHLQWSAQPRNFDGWEQDPRDTFQYKKEYLSWSTSTRSLWMVMTWKVFLQKEITEWLEHYRNQGKTDEEIQSLKPFLEQRLYFMAGRGVCRVVDLVVEFYYSTPYSTPYYQMDVTESFPYFLGSYFDIQYYYVRNE